MPASFTDWTTIQPSLRPGRSGDASVRTQQFGDIQLRLIQYSADYLSAEWCAKGHIVYVIAGEVLIEHQDGPTFKIREGMTYHVSDKSAQDGSAHKLSTKLGASVFIVD